MDSGMAKLRPHVRICLAKTIIHPSNSNPQELTPPILKTNSVIVVAPISSSSRTVQPATVFREYKSSLLNQELYPYLALELRTPRLDDIHHRLWLAGLPTAARPLHRQRLLARRICITEDPNEHLVWFEDQILIKPLPNFLLD